MEVTGGYIYKTTPVKCAMELVAVEDVCVIHKTESGHCTIFLPYTLLQ